MNTSGFATPGIRYQVDSYEAYFDKVKEFMSDCFGSDNRDSVLRIPPVYRLKIIDWLKQNYPQYQISEYELSGIYIQGDLDANIRYAAEQANRMGIIDADPKFMDQVCDALREKYPNKKFEIWSYEEIYKGTDIKHPKDGRSIIVDDFEISSKWHPAHLIGEVSTWMIEKITKEINQGKRIFRTDHNGEMVEILQKKYPDMSFTIKLYSEVFYWEKLDPEYIPTNSTVIIVDSFIVPPPKAFNGKINII